MDALVALADELAVQHPGARRAHRKQAGERRSQRQAIGEAALAGKGKFQADVSSDFGAMAEPPAEAVAAEDAEA